MNFYLDFEATQFSERIISIGCIAENGATFKTLVKPVKNEKVNSFIEQLTGITNEMLETAPTADEAFNTFYEFVKNNNNAGAPVYYCYGNSDQNFIKRTVSGMTDFQAIVFASSIQATLIDYSETVKKFLSTRGIALKKLVALIRHVEEVEQNHDALDDAMMLKECFEGLDTLDKDNVPTKTTSEKQNKAKTVSKFDEAYSKLINENGELNPVKMAGHIFTMDDRNYLAHLRRETWLNMKDTDIPGDGTSENWKVKLTHIRTGDVKYFTEPWVAAMFFNAYVLKGRSTKDCKAINKTMKEMATHPNNFGGYRCEVVFEKENKNAD